MKKETEKQLKYKVKLAQSAANLILDQVDYTKGSCSVTEMVGAVLPVVAIEQARRWLEESKC